MTADEAAVLEALDDTADAFAALPEGPDPHDADDFEQGVRQLRRIVLARHGFTSEATSDG